MVTHKIALNRQRLQPFRTSRTLDVYCVILVVYCVTLVAFVLIANTFLVCVDM